MQITLEFKRVRDRRGTHPEKLHPLAQTLLRWACRSWIWTVDLGGCLTFTAENCGTHALGLCFLVFVFANYVLNFIIKTNHGLH